MEKPKIPENEVERLHVLRALDILDTEQEERFDRVTRMAKRMFGVSISLVSLVDEGRQWFKSKQGLDAEQTPRDISFCGHAINEDGVFIVPNALNDERFHDNPLVTGAPNIRFYAGYPLKLKEGIKIGTLCLIDPEPKTLDEEELQLLIDLGTLIEREIKSIQMATLDELTLISNRRGFLSLAEHSLKMYRRKKMPWSIILFDLDKFKPINDNYGHHEGDLVLITFAKVMRESFRECDIIGRLGGDEFIALITDSDDNELNKILARFANNIASANRENNKPYQIAYSAGVAHFSHDSEKSLEAMLEQADEAMYEEKRKSDACR